MTLSFMVEQEEQSKMLMNNSIEYFIKNVLIRPDLVKCQIRAYELGYWQVEVGPLPPVVFFVAPLGSW